MKRAGKMLVIGLFSLLLSGCMFTTPETSLYRLPKLAGEYESLESQIDALLTNGAEYAAPTSGSNLQSVQMIDLDGDGSEEAVAFFRRASDKKPMKIYIFKADGDSYERYAVIEGTSSQIYSVNYADLDGDGLKEILVGYKSSSDVQGLAIYPLSPGTSESLLTTGYSRYANLDMNGDGKQELLIICSDEESTARVDYYDWDDGALHAKSSLRLSASVAELSRLTAGTLTGGENALFVTGVTGDNLTVTDVLALRSGRLQNIAVGADDYVTKPFSPAELTARVDALLRRMGENTPATHTGELYQPPFLLNLTNRTLEKNGERVKLTQIEYAIVKLFMENSGKALAREEILDAVWGKGYFGELKIVDVNVRRLRLKIEDDAQEPKYISTVWGFGYKWTV